MAINPNIVTRPGGFTFKQFFVAHDRCGMKVSTDAVLLGAWARVPANRQVLDIGCGSGILTIMLAQRLAQQPATFQVVGVELDCSAAQQALENCAQSPWRQNLHICQQDILTWQPSNPQQRYGLIICNPPYYSAQGEYRDRQRATARQTASLGHRQLLDQAAKWLAAEGEMSLVLPADIGQEFIELATREGWSVKRLCRISETAERTPHRYLISLVRQPWVMEEQSLVIRDSAGNYSQAFQGLTRDFYLSMS